MGPTADFAGLSGEATARTLPPTAPSPRLIPQQHRSAEGMRLVVSRGPDKGREFAISEPLTVIGRHRDCDIVVAEATASRYHAELEVHAGRCVLVDGGSLNGTFVNRKPVQRVKLAEGDEIWIGKARFIFRTGAAEEGAPRGPQPR